MSQDLLQVPRRRTDPAQLSAGLRECIENDYHQHTERFMGDLTAADELRSKAIATDSNERTLLEYYCQLYYLGTKFPSDIRIELTWYNPLGYSGHSPVKYSLIQFEQINILFNIGANYSELGYRQPRNESEGLKKAYNYFQLAAGTFRYLITDILPTFPDQVPMGLEAATLEMIESMCLAQAHECFWARAIKEGMKDLLIAKLAMQVRAFYSDSLDHAMRSNSVRSEWIGHMTCKMHFFEAAAQYRAATDCLNRAKYGEEVARLQGCVEACTKALNSSKYASATLLQSIHNLKAKAESDYTRAEKDNRLIYIQEVPDQSALAPLAKGPNTLTKSVVPSQLQDPIGYIKSTLQIPLLFEDVLPFVIYQAARAYAEQVDAYVHRNIVAEIEELKTKARNRLQELHLPGSLDAIEKPLGVPQQLLSYSEELNAKKGTALIENSISDINKLAQESMQLLQEAKENLEFEDREDASQREKYGTDRWTRKPSREAASSLWEEYERYRGYLEAASKSDQIIRQRYDKINHLMRVLQIGKSAIEEYIPNAAVVMLPHDLQRLVNNLRSALSELRQLEVYWEQYISTLRSKANNVDLFPSILDRFKEIERNSPYEKLEPATFEPVYTNYVSLFDGDIRWAQSQGQKMNEILNKVGELNDEISSAKGFQNQSVDRRNAIQSLEHVYSEFLAITGNLEEGRKFYNGVLDTIRSILTRAKEFLYSRRVEGRDLEDKINSATPAPSASPLPAPQPHKVWTPGMDIRFSNQQ